MRSSHKSALRLLALCACMSIIFTAAAPAYGHNEEILHRFGGVKNGDDGAQPQSGLIADGAGNLYGTTELGGTGTCWSDSAIVGCGTVFELIPPATRRGPWTQTILYSFQPRPDGNWPIGGLVFDRSGNLYGTTIQGGSGRCEVNGPIVGCGTIFELMPPSSPGGDWTEVVLYSFGTNGNGDGAGPQAGLIFDTGGNLYGTTEFGGKASTTCPYDCGTVFKLSPTQGMGWLETVLYRFQGPDGRTPLGGLLLDPSGRLYGTTVDGGAFGYGTVFKLTPPAPGGQWTESLLYEFTGGPDGAGPEAALIHDQHGNLYGTASGGGMTSCSPSCGVVFELVPPSDPGGVWSETTIWEFSGGNDGASPFGTLLFDKTGNLYGTTAFGGTPETCTYTGNIGCGTVFRLKPPSQPGESWVETIIYAFFGNFDGAAPSGALTFGKLGALYGTTQVGGAPKLKRGTAFGVLP